MSFGKYVDHGWKLVPIKRGTKGPRTAKWNIEANCIDDPETADTLECAGLAHAYSGTACLDIDVYDLAQEWLLEEHGIDLDALRLDEDAVQIVSGQTNRGKLLYQLPADVEPLPSKTFAEGAFELRCGTRNGRTVQDLIPDSWHPNKQQYKWLGDWRNLPELPAELLELWQDHFKDRERPTTTEADHYSGASTGSGHGEIAKLLKNQDPDADYEGWIKTGMALHHELGDAGFQYWDAWSAKGKKYPGVNDLQHHWDSFGQGGDAGRPVTLGSLRRNQVADADEFEDLTEVDDDYADIWDKQKAKSTPVFNFETLYEISQRPPTQWIIKGIMPHEELVLVYGASGAGKSFVALDMSLAVARGEPWRGHASRQGTVCWIAAEAAGSMRNRARAFEKSAGLDLQRDLATDFYVLASAVNLGDLKAMKALAEAARSIAPQLIVVDTLAAASGGANENSGEDMNQVMEGCRILHKATGATVLLVHHSGKDKSKGARGWSGIKAAVDAELEVTKTVSMSGEVSRSISVTKLRDGEEGELMAFDLEEIEIGSDDDGDAITSCVVTHLEHSPADRPGQRPRQLSIYQRAVVEAATELSMFGPAKEYEVLDAAIGRLPEAPDSRGKDRRRQYCRSALGKLALDGMLELANGLITVPESDDVEDLL